MSKTHYILKSVLAMLLILCIATIYVPQTIYFAQREYFEDYFINLIQLPVLLGLLIIIGISLLLFLTPKKLLKYLTSILLVLSVLIWIHVDFFTVSYGALDGSTIDFKRFNERGYLEIAVYTLAILMALIFNKFITKHLPFVVLLVLIGQLSITTVNIFQEPMDKKLVKSMDNEFFNYSSDKNIILIVLDTFGSEYFQEALTEDPSITKNLDGFVSYTDAISNYSATKGSVPSFLTGKMIPHNIKYSDFLSQYVSKFGLPKIFSNKGYLVSVISVYYWFDYFYKDRFVSEPKISQKTMQKYHSSQLLDYSLFRIFPHFIKPRIFNDGEWLISKEISKKAHIPNSYPEKANFFLDLMTENMTVSNQTPRFKMIHVTTPHPQFRFNRNCELAQFSTYSQAMLEQSMCAMKKLNQLLNKLKENGIYDNSLIVVTSDHGSRVSTDKSLTGFPSYFELSSSGILFMVKGIEQKDDFTQVNQPFSLIKLYDALLEEKLHSSKYDFLKDNNRQFYAYKNHHQYNTGYMQDAPLYEVSANFQDIKSWKLKQFVIHDCEPQNIPLKMTFNINGREGYCSIFGFSVPSANNSGSWTESVDTRIVLELDKNTVQEDKTYHIIFDFTPNITLQQSTINLEVFINATKIGEQLINTENRQTVKFGFSGNLLNTSEQTIIQLLMPDLKSPKEMSMNNDTRKLGLFMRSVKIN